MKAGNIVLEVDKGKQSGTIEDQLAVHLQNLLTPEHSGTRTQFQPDEA